MRRSGFFCLFSLILLPGLVYGLFFGNEFAAAQETKAYPRLVWTENENAELKPAFSVAIAPIDDLLKAFEQIMMEGNLEQDEVSEYLALKTEMIEKIKELNISTAGPFGGSIFADEELFYLLGYFPIAVKQNPNNKQDGPISLESLADVNFPNVFEQIGPEPQKVLRETPDLFTMFGPMFAMRNGDNIVLGTEGIQKRVAKNPKQFLPGTSSDNILSEEIFYFDGEQRKILKTIGRIPLQLGQLAVASVEHQNEALGPILTGVLNTVRDFENLFFEIDRLHRTLEFDAEKSEILLGESYDFTPGGKLATFCKLQKENKSPLLGFFQPEEAICAGIISTELIPEQKEIAFRVLDIFRYAIENKDALNKCPDEEDGDDDRDEIDEEVVSLTVDVPDVSYYLSESGPDNVIVDLLENGFSFDISDGVPEEGMAIALKVMDYIEKFIATGRFDAAYTLRKDGTFLGAIRCNAGNEVALQLENLKELIKEHELGPVIGGMVRINTEEADGMKFSYITLPYKALFDIAPLDEEARAKLRFLDDKTGTIILGCSGDFLVFAMNYDSTIDSLRKTLDEAIAGIKTPGAVPETVAVFSPYELAKCVDSFLGQIDEKDEGMKKILECCQGFIKAGPEAKITCDISYRENGLKTQLRLPSKAVAPCVMWLYRNKP